MQMNALFCIKGFSSALNNTQTCNHIVLNKKKADASVFFPFDCFIFQICTLGLEDLLSAPYYICCVKVI